MDWPTQITFRNMPRFEAIESVVRREAAKLGRYSRRITGCQVAIERPQRDATRSWKMERRAEWGGERFPPTVRPAPEDEARVRERWDEYGLGDL
jgi:hypothetical protein